MAIDMERKTKTKGRAVPAYVSIEISNQSLSSEISHSSPRLRSIKTSGFKSLISVSGRSRFSS